MKKLLLISLLITMPILFSQLTMERVEDLSWSEPYPVGQLVRINSSGDILAVNSTYRSVYHLNSGSQIWDTNLTTSSDISEIYYSLDNRAFVGTATHGLYVATDLINYNWTQILVETQVFSIAVNSSSSIFVGTTDGLYKSDDNGVSWAIAYEYPLKMKIDSSNGIFYIEEYNKGLCKSIDNGETWEEINYNLSKDITINDIQIAMDGTVFISVLDDGIYKLVDNNWVANGFQTTSVNAIHAGKDGYMYCSRADKIFKKTVSQSYWPLLVKETEGKITSFSSNSSKIIAGYTDDMVIFESTDWGSNWSILGTAVYPTVYDICLLDSNVFIGTNVGIYISSDYGTSWNQVLSSYVVNTLEVDDANMILAGTSGGLYTSEDRGIAWNLLTSSPISQPAKILYSGSRYYVGAYNELYRSADCMTWYETTLGSINRPYDMARTSTGRLYIADPYDGVWYTDNQSTWTYTELDDSESIEIGQNGDIYANSRYYVKVLRSGEISWEMCYDGNYGESYYDIFIDSDNVVFLTGEGAFLYGLLGNNWVQISSGLPLGIEMNTILKDDNGYVYTGMASAKGLFKSNLPVTVPKRD